MSDTMEPIDIESIMSEIRAEIREAGYTNEMLSFDDVALDEAGFQFDAFDLEEFHKQIYDLNNQWKIQTYRNLNSNAVVSFVKKVIRKCIRFYVDPIVEDQNRLNANLVRTMNLMNCYISEQNATIATLKNTIQRLERSQKEEGTDASCESSN